MLPGLLDFLRSKLQQVRQYDQCLRTTGEMSWVERGTVPIEDVLEYEARVNELAPDAECTLLCVYDLARMPAPLVRARRD